MQLICENTTDPNNRWRRGGLVYRPDPNSDTLENQTAWAKEQASVFRSNVIKSEDFWRQRGRNTVPESDGDYACAKYKLRVAEGIYNMLNAELQKDKARTAPKQPAAPKSLFSGVNLANMSNAKDIKPLAPVNFSNILQSMPAAGIAPANVATAGIVAANAPTVSALMTPVPTGSAAGIAPMHVPDLTSTAVAMEVPPAAAAAAAAAATGVPAAEEAQTHHEEEEDQTYQEEQRYQEEEQLYHEVDQPYHEGDEAVEGLAEDVEGLAVADGELAVDGEEALGQADGIFGDNCGEAEETYHEGEPMEPGSEDHQVMAGQAYPEEPAVDYEEFAEEEQPLDPEYNEEAPEEPVYDEGEGVYVNGVEDEANAYLHGEGYQAVGVA